MISFPTFPHQNNLFSHDGGPELDAFSCDASNVTGAVDPVCLFTVVEDNNLKGKIWPRAYYCLCVNYRWTEASLS